MIITFLKTSVFCLLLFQVSFAQPDTTARKWGDWQTWGDQGNGTYVNPILPGRCVLPKMK